MLTNKHKLVLSVTGGILLSLPFTTDFGGFFGLFALVPLLIIESSYQQNGTTRSFSLFRYSFLTFLIWNTLTTWWIGYAAPAGIVALIIFNTLLYAAVFQFYHYARQKTGANAMFLLLSIWVTFEFLYLRAEISWTWLHLGNAFARHVKFVQWYEYTGVLGGTLWILAVNILLSSACTSLWFKRKKRTILLKTGIAGMVILLPVTFSLFRYLSYSEKSNPVNITVIQPDIDPYSEKFTRGFRDQLNTMLTEANKSPDHTRIFAAPETAIQGNIDINKLNDSEEVTLIRQFLEKYPAAAFITGAETKKKFNEKDTIPYTARWSGKDNAWFNHYNSALYIDTTPGLQLYHKSQLVTGVEKMPFSKYFTFLGKYAIRIGGSSGNLGFQEHRTVLESPSGIKIAPVICFESLFGEFITGYIHNGAQLVVIITNDGWWKNSDGIVQHLHLARLRAVETRRSVARSANTGVSAFISQRGDLIQTLPVGVQGIINGTVNANSEITFYARYGDLAGRLALLSAIAITLWLGFLRYKRT